MKTKLKQYALRLTITMSIALLLLVLSRFYVDIHPARVQEGMRNIGMFGPLLLLLVFAVRPYLLIPLPIIAVAAGFLFGQWLGTVLIFLGAVMGASISFLIKRRKKKQLRLDDKNMEEMESVKEEIEHHGFKFLLMLRLIPVLHYDLPASISARMNVGWAQYLGATMIGTLPRAVLLGFFGSSLLALYPWKLIVLAVVATGIASLGYTLKKHMEHTFDKKELKEEAKRFQPPV